MSEAHGAGGKTVFNLNINRMYVDILMQRHENLKWNELGLFTLDKMMFSKVTNIDKTLWSVSVDSLQLDNFIKYNPQFKVILTDHKKDGEDVIEDEKILTMKARTLNRDNPKVSQIEDLYVKFGDIDI